MDRHECEGLREMAKNFGDAYIENGIIHVNGVPEIHRKWRYCGFCGKKLDNDLA